MGATSSNDIDFDELAWTVAADGPTAHEGELARLATRARAVGVAGVAVQIVADRTAPPVVRQRAMANVVAALSAVSAVSAGTMPLHAVA